MLDELSRYTQTDYFQFNGIENLEAVCNAPTDKSGIYLVYAISGETKELVYVGRSGKILANGTMFIRQAGLGGIKDRIVNGHQFGKVARRDSWPLQMKAEKIDSVEVHWYVTHAAMYNDCPRDVERDLLDDYFDEHRNLPRWNRIK